MNKNNTAYHPHWIPKLYKAPADFALRCFREQHIPFNRSVDIAYHFFTSDPSSPNYISPSKLNRNTLAKHILKWIANDY